MSVRAYVLIEVASGKTKDVVSALRGVPGVKSADAVTGAYDAIAVIEGKEINAVGKLVVERVHKIDGVVRTTTCLAVELM